MRAPLAGASARPFVDTTRFVQIDARAAAKKARDFAAADRFSAGDVSSDVGERWRIGGGDDAVELVVTCPRIPCNTFRAFIAERGWLKTFTRAAMPGAYLAVVRPGVVRAGDPIEVVFRPDHEVSIGVLFRSQTLERELAPVVLTAADYLDAESLDYARRGETFTIG